MTNIQLRFGNKENFLSFSLPKINKTIKAKNNATF